MTREHTKQTKHTKHTTPPVLAPSGGTPEAAAGGTDGTGSRSSVAWYNLGPAWAIPPGEGREFDVAGGRVAIFRTRAGELFASQPRCPHRGGPLADGIVGGATVVCPLHAYKFDLASGASVGHACGALTTYPVQLTPTGAILLSLAAQPPFDERAGAA